MALSAVFLLALAIIAGILVYPAWRDRRVLARPFPRRWLATVERRLPFYRRLEPGERRQLRQLIQLFLARMRFYGCNGQEIDDEVRVTVAAQACLLLLNRKTGIFPRLRHILVYPYAFWTNHPEHREDGTVSLEGSEMLGESWDDGKVILSWDDIENGASDFGDGYNVVIHEFAHQLDGETGSVNGTPLLPAAIAASWADLMTREYEALRRDADLAKPTVMDYYGATSPAEFFAVASETFFESPHDLAWYHPELYEALKSCYRVDPRRWH